MNVLNFGCLTKGKYFSDTGHEDETSASFLNESIIGETMFSRWVSIFWKEKWYAFKLQNNDMHLMNHSYADSLRSVASEESSCFSASVQHSG